MLMLAEMTLKRSIWEHIAYFLRKQAIKGTESRDRIQIRWQKWIVLGMNT
jgi:hypothetical protein